LGEPKNLPAAAIEKLVNIREKAGYLTSSARCQSCGYLEDAGISCESAVSSQHSAVSNGKISFTREELIELLLQAANR
jgi:hypothetical protein